MSSSGEEHKQGERIVLHSKRKVRKTKSGYEENSPECFKKTDLRLEHVDVDKVNTEDNATNPQLALLFEKWKQKIYQG